MTHKEINQTERTMRFKLYGIRLENLALAILSLRRENCNETAAGALEHMKKVAGELDGRDDLTLALTLAGTKANLKKQIIKLLDE